MENNVIEVKDLVKVFEKKIRAVDGISFTVREGEIFGFLGPNGAGKTTAINVLTTVLAPTSGSVKVCGFDVARDSQNVRKNIGVVPQDLTADEDLTGMENVMLCADLYGVPREEAKKRAKELLSLVELGDAADRLVETYSGGMRRRLELAAGLINRPKVLFLDEPTLGLDVQTRAAIWKYIRHLKEEYKMTLFVTTHYLEEADNLCDRIAIIDRGKIVKLDTPEALKDSIGGDIIEVAVEGDPAPLVDVLKKLETVREVACKEDGTCRLKVKGGDKTAPLVINAVSAAGLRLRKIWFSRPTLDEAYLEFTGRSLRHEEGDREAIRIQRMQMRRRRA
ncbi:MAG: ATP-binding cassette domain-containing protein [Thermoplasmata archaeon]